MDFGTFNTSSTTNRIINETKERDYKINYGYIPNRAYNNNKNKNNAKTLFTVFAICGATYLLWKKIISPTIEILKQVIDPNDLTTNNDRIIKTNEDKRILSGKIKRFSSLSEETKYIKQTNPSLITDVINCSNDTK